MLISKIRNQHNALNYTEDLNHNLKVINGGEGEIRIPLLDIYVNQACNLRCTFCINGTNFVNSNIPLESIDIIKKLQPRVITLTGGGEPSIYRYQKKNIQDYVLTLKEKLGDIPIGMMTNGVVLLSEVTQKSLEWIRVSLNAADRSSYKEIHKSDKFNQVLRNIKIYLNGPSNKVGIGFVYTPDSVNQILPFATLIYQEIFSGLTEQNKEKLTIQFRPVADLFYNRYKVNKDYLSELSSNLPHEENDFKEFIKQHSNLYEVFENKVFSNTDSFTKCYVSLLQMNIDSYGNAYPCPQMAHNQKDSYGNIFDPNFNEILIEKLKSSFECHSSDICKNCSQQKINYLYENTEFSSIPNGNTKAFF